MWNRTHDKTNPGKHAFACYDWNGNLFASGENLTFEQAERMGADAERRMTLAAMSKPGNVPDDIAAMSDDELLRALFD